MRALSLVILALCTSAAGCAPSGPVEQVATDPAALFAQACAKCHAADGSGGLPMAANGPRPTDFTSAEWQQSRADAELIAAIKDGRGAMPPFSGLLTPDQIGALAAHIRKLKRS
jgi:mono/diheme cytochrome c family protein